MRKLFIIALTLLCAGAFRSAAQEVVFMPQWTPQAQFAGFYIAQEKGFYTDEGLNVKIVHKLQSSSSNNMDQLENGEIDILGLQLLQSIIARADGRPIVNVMQVSQVSGLWCVSHNPISKPTDMNGMRVGRWISGYADFCDFLETYNNIKINWVPFINGISLYVYGAVDAMLCYSYNEYVSLTLAAGRIPESNVIKFSDFGYDCPEDALCVNEKYYATHKEEVEKFVRASKRGWEYARNHRDEAIDVTMKYVKADHIQTNRAHQKRMLDEYLSLMVNPKTGKVDYTPVSKETFDTIVNSLYNINHIFQKIEYSDLIR